MLCFVPCCASPPENPSLPVLFARQVDEAEKDYDETLFRSYRKGGLLSAPVTLGKETRRSLTPPVPSRLTFTVPIPAEPLLSFSIGVSTLGEQTLVRARPLHHLRGRRHRLQGDDAGPTECLASSYGGLVRVVGKNSSPRFRNCLARNEP